MNIKKAVGKIIEREDLTQEETRSVFNQIMSGEATPGQMGAFVTALRMKGETVPEITGAAIVMREKALKVNVSGGSEILDTCGTGGSGTGTFNISTTVAFVLAGGGVKVAKHGNRAASSRCGSADVLEKLGVKLDVPLEVTEKCVNTIGIGFLFAPLYHGAMKYAGSVRKEIGIRTIFNILGPLSNPASATCQVLGVYDAALTDIMARVLGNLGTKKAYVIHGEDGVDEVTITGKTRVSELVGGEVHSFSVTPETFGVKKAALDDIKGGSVEENAKIVEDVLSGTEGAKRDVVLMNSSMAFMASGRAKDFKEGASLAAESIDSGKAKAKLDELIKMTNEEGVT